MTSKAATAKRPKRNAAVVNELELIRRAHGGRLSPAAVLNSARKKSSPLHAYFEWDDSKAAEQHRLWQARKIILDCELEMPTTNGGKEIVNAYVNFRSFREDKKGYHSMSEVMSSESLRKIMLREALEDLGVWENRYKRLAALEPVRKAAAQVRSKHR